MRAKKSEKIIYRIATDGTKIPVSANSTRAAQAAFYVNARRLTSSLIPGMDASYEIVFDFVDHALRVHSTHGRSEAILFEPSSVAGTELRSNASSASRVAH